MKVTDDNSFVYSLLVIMLHLYSWDDVAVSDFEYFWVTKKIRMGNKLVTRRIHFSSVPSLGISMTLLVKRTGWTQALQSVYRKDTTKKTSAYHSDMLYHHLINNVSLFVEL